MGNEHDTFTSLNVRGATQRQNDREFAATVGLVSRNGAHAKSTPYRDKVALCVWVVVALALFLGRVHASSATADTRAFKR